MSLLDVVEYEDVVSGGECDGPVRPPGQLPAGGGAGSGQLPGAPLQDGPC